jgi:hypothetical protein
MIVKSPKRQILADTIRKCPLHSPYKKNNFETTSLLFVPFPSLALFCLGSQPPLVSSSEHSY